jgi:membrane-bound lytic murein transglycosylase D
MMTRGALLTIALCASACATAPAPSVVPPPPPATESELQRALKDTYAQIVAHENAPVTGAPKVDIEAGLSMDIPDHKSIRGALALFTGELRPSVQESLIRSAKFKPLIDKALDAEKLPRGLAYLPVIESAYLTSLTSRAGARGIWQFMSETADDYGLRVDWWVDERADPERSTRAAAAYLASLYKQFNDWPLALAAYNAGPTRIRRALDDNGATTFWQLLEAAAIPKETRGYVPTFYATLIIANDPAAYGFKLGEEPSANGQQPTVNIDGPVSLQYIAGIAGIEEKTLRELNPALRRGVTPPGKWTCACRRRRSRPSPRAPPRCATTTRTSPSARTRSKTATRSSAWPAPWARTSTRSWP